jgi:hypothetical protein
MDRERGSALISVVLVVFVLTMVGIAGVLYMTMEDRLSGNDKLQQTCLYAAELGLAQAEAQTKSVAGNSSQINTLLTSATATLTPPGGGYMGVPLGTSFTDQPVSLPAGSPGALTWTAYVRNNGDDLSGSSATVDKDERINVIVVATLAIQGGRSVTRILEEQIFAGGAGGGEDLMKGLNIHGTGGFGIKGN